MVDGVVVAASYRKNLKVTNCWHTVNDRVSPHFRIAPLSNKPPPRK